MKLALIMLAVTLPNVVVNASVSGELVFVNYTDSLTMNASSAVTETPNTVM